MICEDLWERSADLDHPEEAMAAFDDLKWWIEGFRKNSRHRPKGLGYFHSADERARFQDLNAMQANLKDIAKEDNPSQDPSQPVVSGRFRSPVIVYIIAVDTGVILLLYYPFLY